MDKNKSHIFQPTCLEKFATVSVPRAQRLKCSHLNRIWKMISKEFSLLIQTVDCRRVTGRKQCNKLCPHQGIIPAVATAES